MLAAVRRRQMVGWITLASGLVPAVAGAAPLVLTEHGVPGLTIGRTLAAVRADGLVGKLSPGCELASPRPSFAPLRAPLVGSVEFDGSGPKAKLITLNITKGAMTDRGIRIGASAAAVRRAYPKARVEHSAAPNPLEYDAIVVTRGGEDRIWFLLNKRGGHVQSMSLPGANFCE